MRPIDADEIKKDFAEILEHNYADDYARGFKAALVGVLGYKTIAPPPNDPLTLEELREMVGKPVWICLERPDSKTYKGWALLREYRPDNDAYLLLSCEGFHYLFKASTYGYLWLAYRRKPEGAGRV